MDRFVASVATEAIFDLSEGVLWDDHANLIRWIDLLNGKVLAGKLVGTRVEILDDLAMGQTVGAVALADDGGLLVAVARGLATISTSGEVSLGPDILGDRPDARLNDGTVDLFGAFVVGTAALGDGDSRETLLRVWPNGRVETLREGVGLSNGVAFSPDGGTIYHVDTFAGTVAQHSYGSGPLDASEPWVTVIEALPAWPDGLTVDMAGALWVALWGGSSVRRYSPSGELLAEVTVDAAQASCAAFVGADYATLAITTARAGLENPADQSGGLFLADVGITGPPPHRWAGSTTTPYWRTDTA